MVRSLSKEVWFQALKTSQQGVHASAASIVAIALLPQMPGWAWSKPCCRPWLPEGPALG